MIFFLKSKYGQFQFEKHVHGVSNFSVTQEALLNFLIPIFSMEFQLEIEKMVKDSYSALESSKTLYKEAEEILCTELGLDPKNPLQSILESTESPNVSIKSLKESFLKTGRLDSEYYQAKYDVIENYVKNYRNGYCKLENLIMDYSGGFAFSSNDYMDNSNLMLIRINNIKNLNLDMTNAVFLKDELKNLSPKDIARKNDILISMSGSIGLSCVINEEIEAVTNQRILKISIKDFNQNVLSLLLNSIFGKLQFERIGTGGVQTNISSFDIFNILIPKIDFKIQEAIAFNIQKSFNLRKEAKDLLNEAKHKVEEAIMNGGGGTDYKLKIFKIYYPKIKAKLRDSKYFYRLGEWMLIEEIIFTKESFSHLNITTKTLKNSFGVSGRLDSEYYQKKYEAIENKIKSKAYAKLGDLVDIKKSIEPGSLAYQNQGIPFVRVSNLSKFRISQTEIFLQNDIFNNDELENLYPKKNTILLSKDGSVGIAYCLDKNIECITSGAILHLNIKKENLILPRYLTLVLNSITTKLQAERDSGGSIISHWKVGEIQEIFIPLLDSKIQEQIESKITQSFELRAKSKELLEQAKQKVENAIIEKRA